MAKIGQAASVPSSPGGQHVPMTTAPNKSRLILVYGGRANTEVPGSMPVRRYRLARVSFSRDENPAKSPAGHRNRNG